MGSSLIYVAIVAMWAGLLIPMWLRRHDTETEVRSVDRFSTAMRILSRRTPPPPDRRYLVMPQRPATATAPLADVPRTASRRPPTARPAARPTTAHGQMLARRRRLLAGLAVVAFFTLALTLAGFVSWWWQFVSDLAVLAFVAHLRAEAKRSAGIARRRQQLRARRTTPSAPVAWAATPMREAFDVPMPAVVASTTAVGSGPLVVDEDTWEPVPVPLPTYVNAPVAERPEPAVIDLSQLDEWAAETREVREGHPAHREPLFDQEAFDDDFDADDEHVVEEIVQRRRAVNS